MATTITSGTVTSFANTPQAGTDVYLAAVTGLTEDSSTIVWLNVMANDLGGAAKILYSLDDGASAGGAAPTDLLSQDLARAEGCSTDTSLGGARIWITSDGKVGYDSATLSPAFRAQLQALNPGEFLTDSFTYAIRMSSGALSWATVTVQFAGANDAPVVTGAVAGNAVEDGGLVTLNALANASDVDAGSALSVVGVPETLPAGVTYNAATASFTINPADAAYQHLAAGQTTNVVVNYGVTDGTATTPASVSFTVTGTNDMPVVSAALTTSAAEGASSYTQDLLAGASDVDDGETATLSVTDVTYSVDGGPSSATAPAGVSVSGSTLTVDPTNAAFDHLAVGASTVIVLNYNVQDAQGATVAQSETITITGTNDVPVVGAALTTSAAEGAASYTQNLLAGATDADDGETATLAVVGLTYTVDGGPSSTTAPAGMSVSASTLTVDPTNAAFNHLAVGASTVIVLNYNVQDAQGATVAQSETITITGTNDVPVVAAALTTTAAEGAASYTQNLLTGATDADDGETATLAVTGLTYAVDGGPSSATAPAGVSVTGSTLTVDPTNAAFNHLAVGASTVILLNYNVQDAQGATVAQTETITITGTNDVPVVTAALTTTAAEGVASYTQNLLAGATDADDGETATLAVVGVTYSVDGGPSSATAPAGVSVSGGTLTVDPTNSAFNHLAVGASTVIVLSYSIQDAQGATVAQSETITITGTNDVPVVAAALTTSAAEGAASYTQNLLTGATDADDGETATLTVTGLTYAVDGGPSSATAPAGVSVVGSTLTVDPTNAAFNHLAVGASTVIVLNYNVQDAQGATVAQSETITITGTNDVPVVTAALTTTAAEGGASYTQNLLTGATDADDGETATLTVTGLTYAVDGGPSSATAPAGVSVAGSTLTVDPTSAGFNHLAVGASTVIVLNYNVQDAQGATVAQSETITITGTNDVPVVAAALTTTAAEGAASYTQNLLTGATDADDGETATLTVTGLTYAVDGGPSSATAPAGVSVSSSTLTVDPTNAAFNSLAVGQNTTVVLNYSIQDAQGATVAQSETITITGTNDAPVLAGAATPVLDAVDENAGAPTGAVGTLVSALADLNPPAGGLDNVSDADSGAVTGIALTATNSANGTWWYSTNGGSTWTAVGAVSGSSALLLAANADTRIYFQGNSGFDGTVADAITFRAWDQTTGTAGTKVDTLANGGSTAFSAATDTAAITVNAVNEDPVVSADVLYVSNSTAVTLPTSVLLGNDTDIDGLALSVSSVTVVSGSLATPVTINPNGTFSFTTGATGGTVASPTVVTLSYTASDGAGGTTTGSITLNVLNTTAGGGGDVVNLTGVGSYQGSYIDGKAGSDTLSDGAALSVLQGGAGSDQLNGNAGNDLLVGGDGNDALVGGAGNDVLRGSIGNNDSMDGGAGSEDLLDFSDGTVAVNFTLAQGGTSGSPNVIANGTGGLGNNDSYFNMEGVIGTGLGDTLTGSSSNDVIRGGGGNDTINGAGGAGDLIDFSDGAAGINFTLVQGAALTSFNAAAAGLGTDQYQNIEGAIGTAFADTLTGSSAADTLRGGSGDDVIDGSGGNDRIQGGAGADTLTGGTGALSQDTFVFDSAPNAVDTVTDFEADAGDRIELSTAVFTALATPSGSALAAAEFASSAGTGASDAVAAGVRVIYDSATGNLYYDSDGGGSANRTLFATLDSPTGTFDHNDVRVGP